MSSRQGPEFPRVNGVGEEIDQLRETVIRYERVGCLKKFEFSGVGRENLTESADLIRIETFGFEYLIGDKDAVVVLIGIEHPDPQFVDIVVGGESVAVRIDEG